MVRGQQSWPAPQRDELARPSRDIFTRVEEAGSCRRPACRLTPRNCRGSCGQAHAAIGRLEETMATRLNRSMCLGCGALRALLAGCGGRRRISERPRGTNGHATATEPVTVS